jgi:hypothetical protein
LWQETAANKGVKQVFAMVLKRLLSVVNLNNKASDKRMGREWTTRAPHYKLLIQRKDVS